MDRIAYFHSAKYKYLALWTHAIAARRLILITTNKIKNHRRQNVNSMAQKLNQITLYDKPLFSWYQLSTPIEKELSLPSESCFAYILQGDHQDVTKSGLFATTGTVILSLCGRTVERSFLKIEAGYISTIIVHFNQKVLQEVFAGEKPKFWKELGHPLKKDSFQEDASALIKAYFMSVAKFFEHKTALSEDILVVKLKEIILLLLQTEESSHLNLIIRRLFSDKTFSFKKVIEANLYEPLDLHRLAAMTNNSMASFKRKFNKTYDGTPAKYITQKKLEKACSYLALSQNSIKEICYDCGFINPSSFSRMFKSEFGYSPTEFKKNLNE
ncbi:AraC family transcriptional regulator [Aquimarina sp. ERC-38]|uniref:helix-turn-helix domain-containing protein n=1 Tax=Aquimarina sp. ERC-38 TaxID=2949996 RepID=UPI002245D3D3|nr:AraC family transcriptional regulator [Aquimarina sp. ERC-38]UZO80379.1 AraC family transcriptional regulator [Aquimarina sp. ERC-38]